MSRLPSLLCLIALLITTMCSSGCALDRTWFQMSSDSPMPFFGLDFRLPRRTTQSECVSPPTFTTPDEFTPFPSELIEDSFGQKCIASTVANSHSDCESGPMQAMSVEVSRESPLHLAL